MDLHLVLSAVDRCEGKVVEELVDRSAHVVVQDHLVADRQIGLLPQRREASPKLREGQRCGRSDFSLHLHGYPHSPSARRATCPKRPGRKPWFTARFRDGARCSAPTSNEVPG